MDGIISIFRDAPLGSLQTVIFSFFVGACLAGAAMVYHRRSTGALVRYLLEEEAFSPESAKTLRDAEQELSLFVRLSVRHNPALKRLIAFAPPSADTADGSGGSGGKKPGLSDTPLYIPPEARERAEGMYGGKYAADGNMWLVLLSVLLFGIVASLSAVIIPYLISMLNGLLEKIF